VFTCFTGVQILTPEELTGAQDGCRQTQLEDTECPCETRTVGVPDEVLLTNSEEFEEEVVWSQVLGIKPKAKHAATEIHLSV
jgi:hypothetical protein